MLVPFPKYERDIYNNIFLSEEVELRFSYETILLSPKTIEECPQQYIINDETSICVDGDRPWFNWYNWNCDNWGVKWDACSPYIEENSIGFDSPWTKPSQEIFQGIADKFEVEFTLEVYNEDGGWEECDYIFSPHKEMEMEMEMETSQWQIDENQNQEDYDEERNEEIE